MTVPIAEADRKSDSPYDKNKKFEILKKCTGFALPGQTTYIIGASGAGKTTLLNLLSDRIALQKGAELSGEILLNDRHKMNNKLFG